MHTFLLRARPTGSSLYPKGQAIFACVASGAKASAEGVVLGELHRAGWEVLELMEPGTVRRQFPALKRHPVVAQVMAAARQRGMAFLVLGGEKE